MYIHAKFIKTFGVDVFDIDDICVCRCQSENGRAIMIVSVHIFPEKSMNLYTEHSLLHYSGILKM